MTYGHFLFIFKGSIFFISRVCRAREEGKERGTGWGKVMEAEKWRELSTDSLPKCPAELQLGQAQAKRLVTWASHVDKQKLRISAIICTHLGSWQKAEHEEQNNE